MLRWPGSGQPAAVAKPSTPSSSRPNTHDPDGTLCQIPGLAGKPAEATGAANERSAPAVEYTLALIFVFGVLAILCAPSPKGSVGLGSRTRQSAGNPRSGERGYEMLVRIDSGCDEFRILTSEFRFACRIAIKSPWRIDAARGFCARRRVLSSQGSRVLIGDRQLLNFASNDYLNLAGTRAWRRRPPVRPSATVVGRGLLHWCRVFRPRALGPSSGEVGRRGGGLHFPAATSPTWRITALAGPEDPIFSDELNHASLIDGCRLSRAIAHVYRHGDVNHLADLLQSGPGPAG